MLHTRYYVTADGKEPFADWFVELEAAPEFDKHLVMNRCLGREVVAIAVAIAGGLTVDRAVYFWMARLALEQALKGSLCRLEYTRLRNVDAMPLPIHAGL